MSTMQSLHPTVMVVGDDALAARLRAIGSRRGYRTLAIDDASEAVRRFQEEPPSTVVLDGSAGARSLDALALFRRTDRGVPVLVVSGPADPGTVVQVMRGGAADFLCAPVEDTHLEAAVDRLLAERRLGGPPSEVARLVERLAALEDAVRRLVVVGESQAQRDVLRGCLKDRGAAAVAGRDASAGTDVSAEPPAPASPGSLKDIARAAAREAERTAISRMLQRTHWNRREAAEILGISYKALLNKIKENGLDKPSTS